MGERGRNGLRRWPGKTAKKTLVLFTASEGRPDIDTKKYRDMASVRKPTNPKVGKWQPIATAPKDVNRGSGPHRYGKRIVVYEPKFGRIVSVRWWETSVADGGSGFVDDGGNMVVPSHWIVLPKPPEPDDK
jgi:hypothetical protein